MPRSCQHALDVALEHEEGLWREGREREGKGVDMIRASEPDWAQVGFWTQDLGHTIDDFEESAQGAGCACACPYS